MPHRPVTLHAERGAVALEIIRRGVDELLAAADDLPRDFPAEVLAAAEDAAQRKPGTDIADDARRDLTGVPFVTLDPASSTDLDQAMHLERSGTGYRVRYAIADVPWFVALDGPVDQEARRRGATVYLPDRRIPLHPEVLSEGVASLLPDQDAPVFVWSLDLDERGEVVGVDLERALIRSREKLDYEGVQTALDEGRGHPQMLLLQEIGALRALLEAERGGASLSIPEQEVEADGDRIRLTWRSIAPIEDANAQISLMTGMAAAALMIEHGAGILRTMPPADDAAMDRFRRQAEALGIDWPDGLPYGRFLRTLDWHEPSHLALLNFAGSLFRGASYAAFTRAEELPEDTVQAAIAAPYAHTTAPLRRLVDRFVLLVCHAHARGEAPDPVLLNALAALPEIMRTTGGRGGDLERRAIDLVEIAALSGWVGEEIDGTVIERREASRKQDGSLNAPVRVEVQMIDPPVTAWVPMDAALGETVRIRVVSVDPVARRAELAPADAEPAPADQEG
ncbi:RNB domain-containing ribonuclease [Brachybacterium sp. DNPG3]